MSHCAYCPGYVDHNGSRCHEAECESPDMGGNGAEWVDGLVAAARAQTAAKTKARGQRISKSAELAAEVDKLRSALIEFNEVVTSFMLGDVDSRAISSAQTAVHIALSGKS